MPAFRIFRSVAILHPVEIVAVTVLIMQTVSAQAEGQEDAFLRANCVGCHQGVDADGGLDLTTLSRDLAEPGVESRWVRMIDRVRDGEMPPADADSPPKAATASFVKSASRWLREFQHTRDADRGRVRARRLTRREVERSLHDLLGIDIPLADQLPEDRKTNGFTTVADGQAMSHFQMERHLAVVDVALDEAFRRAMTPTDQFERDFDAAEVARRNPKQRCREPELRNGQAAVWSSGLIFYGRLPATTAPESGWYHFNVTVSGLKLPPAGGVWSTVNTGLCVSSAPLLTPVTAFEATTEPRTIAFDAWLPKLHMLEIRPGDVTLKRARFEGGQVGTGEGEPQDVPGVAIDRVTMRRIHRGATDDDIRQLLFGDLEVERADRNSSSRIRTNAPRRDVERLMIAFARRAFRRPVTDEQISAYVGMAHAALDEQVGIRAALRVGYRALLCSPRFLYLTEEPGPLDDYAIASRLSYFLTGSTPDAELAGLADAGRLRDPETIRAEADRLLTADRGRQFVEDFAAEWLDLDQINFTEPDRRMFPEFDAIVQSAMLDETHSTLQTLLNENLSVARLIDSDFSYLNSRLARFYRIDGVTGDELRRFEFKPEHHRGGVLTQGAILKVTANGSTTSPVVRGVWVSERLLGTPIPPPPDNVPAIEPDIRGATSIREQLARHRSQASCAVCHVKIDPPGFALENYNPAGQWRDRYFQNGNLRAKGPVIDASYELPDGRAFRDVGEFKTLVTAEPRRLAVCLAGKLVTFGTGAPISFADREAVAQIADEASGDEYGFRSIVRAVVTSPVFLSK